METSEPKNTTEQNSDEKGTPTPEEQAFVERIENLTDSYEAIPLILLTWSGLKPVSEFRLETYDSEDDPKRIEQITRAEKLFSDLGLFWFRSDKKFKGKKFDAEGKGTPHVFHSDQYYLAKSKEDLEYFKAHFGQDYGSEVSKRIGQMLGYPESTISAWTASDRSLTILDWNDPIYDRDEMIFSTFRLSKDNKEEEFKTIKRWSDEIKRLAPNVWKKIVENNRRVRERTDHQ